MNIIIFLFLALSIITPATGANIMIGKNVKNMESDRYIALFSSPNEIVIHQVNVNATTVDPSNDTICPAQYNK